jgi:hypothetical protein
MAAFGVRTIVCCAAVAALGACTTPLDRSGYDVRATPSAGAAQPNPVLASVSDAQEKALFETSCGGCHGLDVVTGQQMSRTAWATTVDQMIDKGAALDPDQAAQVTDYLARHFGSG